MKKKLDLFTPSPYLTFSVHLDGLKEEHDHAVAQEGVYDRAVEAIEEAVRRGFRVTVNCTLFNNAMPERVAEFFDAAMRLGVEGITVSPGYAYERAPAQDHFLTRYQTKSLFRDIFRRGKEAGRKWRFNQSSLYLDFLAGNQSYLCTPWGNPTRNIFGWQKPCYLLGEGYAKTFRELMETTDWDSYGTGRYEKCANCMVHCGYEPTAVVDTVASPLKALSVFLRGVKTDGEMAPEIDLTRQRPAQYVFEKQVAQYLGDGAAAPSGKAKARPSEAAHG
jgi:hopanoid biosynthesis associated radical SAM protein HpnH